MATLTAAHGAHAPAPFLTRMLSGIGHALVAMGEANPRLKRIDALQRMSDEQLAERGIRREDIVRHVFHDVFYI